MSKGRAYGKGKQTMKYFGSFVECLFRKQCFGFEGLSEASKDGVCEKLKKALPPLF